MFFTLPPLSDNLHNSYSVTYNRNLKNVVSFHFHVYKSGLFEITLRYVGLINDSLWQNNLALIEFLFYALNSKLVTKAKSPFLHNSKCVKTAKDKFIIGNFAVNREIDKKYLMSSCIGFKGQWNEASLIMKWKIQMIPKIKFC